MSLPSIKSVAKLISQVAKRQLTSSDTSQYSPEYRTAMDAVLKLLEQRVEAAYEVGVAVAKARQVWVSSAISPMRNPNGSRDE